MVLCYSTPRKLIQMCFIQMWFPFWIVLLLSSKRSLYPLNFLKFASLWLRKNQSVEKADWGFPWTYLTNSLGVFIRDQSSDKTQQKFFNEHSKNYQRWTKSKTPKLNIIILTYTMNFFLKTVLHCDHHKKKIVKQ